MEGIFDLSTNYNLSKLYLGWTPCYLFKLKRSVLLHMYCRSHTIARPSEINLAEIIFYQIQFDGKPGADLGLKLLFSYSLPLFVTCHRYS
jgi:hypothetical protein